MDQQAQEQIVKAIVGIGGIAAGFLAGWAAHFMANKGSTD